MTAAVVGTPTSYGSAAAETSSPLPYPTGITAGEGLVIVAADGNTAGTFDTPSGFTEVTHIGGSNSVSQLAIFKKVATGSESGTIAITQGGGAGNSRRVAVMFRVSSYNGFDVSATSTDSSGTATTKDSPTVTTTENDELVIIACMVPVASTGLSASQTLVKEVSAASSKYLRVESYTAATAGATGAKTWNWTGSSTSLTLTASIKTAASSSLTDVDTDETIYTGQTSVAYTGTGLTNADGLVVTTDGVSASATSFSATNATSGTFTAPSLSACFTAGTKFGSATADIQDGGVSLGTLAITFNAEPAYTVHTVTDTSQAGDAGCIYYWINNAGTDVANGDQIIFDNKSGNVTMDSQGFLTFAGGETQTTYRARDDTDNTWSAAWSTFTTTSAGTFVGDVVRELARDLVTDTVQ